MASVAQVNRTNHCYDFRPLGAMSSVHILQFPRADNDEGFVLIQVTCAGSKSLDLKLVGTEGEEPYMVKRECIRISSLFSLPLQASFPIFGLGSAN